VSIVTKGTMVRRDIDVLQHLAKVADVHVCVSIPTIDLDIWRTLEPGTPPPLQRMRAVRALTDAGIHAGVVISPIVPGLTTRRRHLNELVKIAVEHGARFLGTGILHLKPGVRQYFLGYLSREHPELVAGYNRLYRTANAEKQYQDKINDLVHELKGAAGLSPSWPEQNKRILKVVEPSQQLLLFATAS
jgi:DNA repair photolyase